MSVAIDLAWLAAVLICAIASVTDLLHRIIPNTLFVVAVAAAAALIVAGLLDWADSALGFAIMGGVAFCVYVLGGFGGGDVKLLAGVGALVGAGASWEVMLLSYAAAVAIFLASFALNLILGRRPAAPTDGSEVASPPSGLLAAAPKSIAFAPAVLIGCAAAPWAPIAPLAASL